MSPMFLRYIKINSKWIRPKLRAKPTKLVEENVTLDLAMACGI